MLTELVTRALISAWLFLFGLWFGVAPASPARRPAPAPRAVARQWRAIGQLPTGRIYAVRVQVVIA
jgi:hypothetical protein